MGSPRNRPVRDKSQRTSPPPHGRALARYLGLWLAAGAIVAVIVLQLVHGSDSENVSLPPVRETKLVDAARTAACELRRERPGRALRPAVSGPSNGASSPGVYERTPPPSALVGANRRGIIVIHYRPSLDEEHVAQLQRLQEAVPEGTIVAPNANMSYEITVTAWRRLLGCHRFDDETVDAIRLFRGRYLGTGPG